MMETRRTEKVRKMDDTLCTTTTVTRGAVLLACSLCGPVGVYLCASEVAVMHHITLAHQEQS